MYRNDKREERVAEALDIWITYVIRACVVLAALSFIIEIFNHYYLGI